MDWDKPLRTKDGRGVATVVHGEALGRFPVLVMVHYTETDQYAPFLYDLDGTRMTSASPVLENYEPAKKARSWVNVYRYVSASGLASTIHATPEAALDDARRNLRCLLARAVPLDWVEEAQALESMD